VVIRMYTGDVLRWRKMMEGRSVVWIVPFLSSDVKVKH